MIAYVDARRGASGTSLLSALIDAGADADELAGGLRFLAPGELKLRVEETVVDGLRTSRIRVDDADVRIVAGPVELLATLSKGNLPDGVHEQAASVYGRLAAAEARVHGVEPAAIRFEELATLRSVVGVVGAVLALGQLDVDVVSSSSVPFGHGTVETHHGRLALPTPATLELLRGLPVVGQHHAGELVTPTGAALLASLASSFGEIPAMTIEAVGVGSAPSTTTAIVTRVVIGRR